MRQIDYLFSGPDLRAVVDGHDQRLARDIESIDADEFLSTSPEDLAEHLIAEFTIDVPTLSRGNDDIVMEHHETKVDVSKDRSRDIRDRGEPFYLTGTEYVFHIPFEGDAELFKCSPSTFTTSGRPVGRVAADELVLTYSVLEHNAEGLRARLDGDLRSIEQHLAWVRDEVLAFNGAVAANVHRRIEARRERLLSDRGLAASLGFKIRERPDAPRTFAAGTKRRPRPGRPRPAGTAPYRPEPALPNEDYEHILNILSSMVEFMERSPGSFKTMKEEELRNHFLVQLNGHYEGGATGETFNFEGKTDILVRAEGRTIFIAECKVWNGPQSLSRAIDQLLGYTSWRDTKTALLVFNRGRDLSKVLAKVPEVMRLHPNFKREHATGAETRFQYTFAHRDDSQRELTLTVLVFEVPR